MDSGGGTTTTSSVNVPEFLYPHLEELAGWYRDETMRDAPLYGGDRVADLTNDELAGMTHIRGLSVPFQIGDASNRAAAASDYAMGVASNFQPGTFDAPMTSTGKFTSDEANYYMSPYSDAVTDIAARAAQRNADVLTARRGTEASRAGAYGGYRHGIQQSEAEKNTAGLVNDIWTKGRQDAYLNAQQQFERDRQADLATQFANQQAGLETMRLGEASRQFGAGLGLDAARVGLGAAGALGSLGQLENAIETGNIDMLMGSGGLQRGVENALLGIDYEDWLKQTEWDENQLRDYANFLYGSGRTSEQPDNRPDPFAQLIGTGLGIASLFLP